MRFSMPNAAIEMANKYRPCLTIISMVAISIEAYHEQRRCQDRRFIAPSNLWIYTGRSGVGQSFMDKFVIRGGNPLVGTIHVSGAKNSALPCMAAAILTEDEVTLENMPQVRDIETEKRLLASMGAEVGPREGRANDRITISGRTLSDPVARYEIVKTMRASSLVLGPLIARTGMARVAMPGGCAIGGRPIDLHIKGLEKMGATIIQEHGYLEARAERLKGAHLVFDKITVTGTEDLLMAAVLAEGETVMENCAREPEVTDLAALLTAMGAKIEGAGNGTM